MTVHLCARAWARRFDDEEKRLVYGKMGRERVLDKFTWERAARELVDVYKEAIINANN